MQISQINNCENNRSFKAINFFEEARWNPDLLKKVEQNKEVKKLAALFQKEATDIEVHCSSPAGTFHIFDMNEVSPRGNNLICTIKDLNKFSAEETYKKYMGL